MQIKSALDIKKKANSIIKFFNFNHIKKSQIIFFRSYNSKAKAYARIWALPKIWQKALNLKPYYCIEVLSEKFDKLSLEKQIKILLHELLHIPKNFSGALLPHNHRGKIKINRDKIENFCKQYKKII